MQFDPEKILKNERWLDPIEIKENLKGIQYIIMATPSENESDPTIRFTLFLNTRDAVPDTIVAQVVEKFATDNGIDGAAILEHGLLDVAFSLTGRETPMPLALYEKVDAASAVMHVVEFTGTSRNFKESKEGLTGWSYVRN